MTDDCLLPQRKDILREWKRPSVLFNDVKGSVLKAPKSEQTLDRMDPDQLIWEM